jgi:hypothetical protein
MIISSKITRKRNVYFDSWRFHLGHGGFTWGMEVSLGAWRFHVGHGGFTWGMEVSLGARRFCDVPDYLSKAPPPHTPEAIRQRDAIFHFFTSRVVMNLQTGIHDL